MVPTQSETWHDQPIEDVTKRLGVDLRLGLTSTAARQRLATQGRNELRRDRGISRLAIMAAQFESLVIWVLIGAALVSIVLGEAADGVAIIAIVLLNAVIGFVQEYRAEKAAAALARLAAPRARVVRDGRAQVICTDKTGTLTVGEMTARRVVTASRLYRISGEGYRPEGAFFSNATECPVREHPLLHAILEAAAACNDAELQEQAGRAVVVGDPTDGALLVAAQKGGVTRSAVEARSPRIHTIPFSSDRKRMAIVREHGDGPVAFVKGAPEVILERCARILTDAVAVPISAIDQDRMERAAKVMRHAATGGDMHGGVTA